MPATYAYRSFTMAEMARDKSQWPMLSDMLVSGQVETKDFVAFMSANRDFAAWHFRRGAGRHLN
jgi:hypothetical protein